MEKLFEALVTRYNACAIAGSTNGFWAHPAPEKKARPYVTWLAVSNAPEETSDSWEERPLIQLSVFSADEEPNEVMQLFALLKAAFDKARFTVDGMDLVYIRREAERGPLADPDGGWMYSGDWRVMVAKAK